MAAPMTWQVARVLAAEYATRHLHDPAGPPLAVAPWGWENATDFQALVDTLQGLTGDPLQGLADAPCLLVSKATRQVRQIGWEEALPLRQEMRRVGDWKGVK